MSWQSIPISSFLKPRSERFKPTDDSIKGLKRIEKIDFSGNIYISDKPSKTDMILVKKGDFVISGINVEKGAMAIYQGDEDVVATIHYSSYVYNKEKIDLQFLKHFLKSPKFIDALKEQVPGGIKTEIKPKHILPLKIYIPTDLAKQKRIVEKLETNNLHINNQTNELTHQLDLVKQLRQAFLREAVRGKLTAKWRKENWDIEPASELLKKINAEKEKLLKEGKLKKQKPLPPIKADEIPFEIPENWEWCRLGTIVQSMTNGIYKQAKFYNENGIGCFRMYNISEGKVNFNSLKRMSLTENEISRYKLSNNDLLLNRVNSIELLGKSALIPALKEPFVFESKNIRVILYYKDFTAPYVNYLFLTSLIKSQVYQSFKKVTGQASISQEKLNPIIIPLPSKEEQIQIVTKLDELMQYCDKLEESIKTSRQQNEMLLQQVLREALEPKEKEIN